MIVRFEGALVYGRQISTSFSAAVLDCTVLWEKLGAELKLEGEDSYGVSYNMRQDGFDYLAGVALQSAASPPVGFIEQDISAGVYARCQVPALEDLSAAYSLLYDEDWAATHSKYAVSMLRPCFELYPAGYSGGRFYVYAPVDEKS